MEVIEWRLAAVLLPFFANHRLPQITAREIDRYRQAQVRERDRLRALRAKGKRTSRRPLSNGTINRTIGLLATILDLAVEYGLLDANPARSKNRRLKADKPARPYLDSAAQFSALLTAAGRLDSQARDDRQHIARRTMLATLLFSGVRVSELVALKWRDIDLAGGWLSVRAGKTAAATRKVKIRPALRDELAGHKARTEDRGADRLVFATATGEPHHTSNVRTRVLARALAEANKALAKQDEPPLPRLTPHGCRRSFASLLYAIGEPPPVVMAELGHTDPALALAIYAHAMRRDDAEQERLRALVEGADWALVGTTGTEKGARSGPIYGSEHEKTAH